MSRNQGLLQFHEPESWRFYVYGEDDEGDPLFSFWMNLTDNTGVCIYDRSGGTGKWLSTAHDDEEYTGQPPTADLKAAIRDSIGDGPGVRTEDIQALADHEAYFFRVMHGTIEQKGRAPDELLSFIEHVIGNEVRLA
jgi:hypothetical protein